MDYNIGGALWLASRGRGRLRIMRPRSPRPPASPRNLPPSAPSLLPFPHRSPPSPSAPASVQPPMNPRTPTPTNRCSPAGDDEACRGPSARSSVDGGAVPAEEQVSEKRDCALPARRDAHSQEEPQSRPPLSAPGTLRAAAAPAERSGDCTANPAAQLLDAVPEGARDEEAARGRAAGVSSGGEDLRMRTAGGACDETATDRSGEGAPEAVPGAGSPWLPEYWENGRVYASEARVVLLGHGADEQCGSYGRHRTKFRTMVGPLSWHCPPPLSFPSAKM